MNIELVLIKYHEGREWIKQIPGLSSITRHDFARFYAESDWDDPKAAWKDFHEDNRHCV